MYIIDVEWQQNPKLDIAKQMFDAIED